MAKLDGRALPCVMFPTNLSELGTELVLLLELVVLVVLLWPPPPSLVGLPVVALLLPTVSLELDTLLLTLAVSVVVGPALPVDELLSVLVELLLSVLVEPVLVDPAFVEPAFAVVEPTLVLSIVAPLLMGPLGVPSSSPLAHAEKIRETSKR